MVYYAPREEKTWTVHIWCKWQTRDVGWPILLPWCVYTIFHHTRTENTTFAFLSRERKWHFRPEYGEKKLFISNIKRKFKNITLISSIYRRFVWNFFRLENEHLNNCGKFRAVRDISIAPLESSDQIQILRMMDEENGVVNRGKRRAGGKKQGGTKEDKRMLLKDETIDIDVSNAS